VDLRKRLQMVDNKIEYHASGELKWALPLDHLVLIAEYTTNQGPYVDDHFVVFVTIESEEIYFLSCSFYAEGRKSVLNDLANRLGAGCESGLTGASAGLTEWNSRVVWPPHMLGKPLFTFTSAPPPHVRNALLNRVLGKAYAYAISANVREYIEAERCNRKA